MTATWTSLLWFALVLVLIPLALWLLRRSGWPPGAGNARRSGLRLVDSLPIGPQQRLVTVEIADGARRHRLVLGVTPQSITPLRELHEPAPEAPPLAPAWSEWLTHWSDGQTARNAAASAPASASNPERPHES
ncbi:MAG: hypothetical protein RJA44_716 [Pseudomonadota bacterium]|jgi:flagellar protein FliO/FliZ